MILGCCRKLGLSDEQAEETLQAVLVRLADRMRTFIYDPSRSFRAWLRRLVRSQVIDDWRRRRVESGREVQAVRLDQIPDPEEPADLDEPDHPLLELGQKVQAAVRTRVGVETWEVFWMADIDGVPLPLVAQRFGKTYHAAFRAAPASVPSCWRPDSRP